MLHEQLFKPIRQTAVVLSLLAGGCNQSADRDDVTTPELSREAARFNAIADDAPPPSEPWQPVASGVVLQVLPAAVKIQTDQHPDGVVMATSDEVEVYEDGDSISLSSLKPGDRVNTFSQREGSREAGWSRVLARIEVIKEDASAAAQEQSENQNGGGAAAGEFAVDGVVVGTEPTTVTIRDVNNPELEPSVIPVDPLVTVSKGDNVGGVSLLEKGDVVRIEMQTRGNRQDGYVQVGTTITVAPDESE